jgi:hypothetical protein
VLPPGSNLEEEKVWRKEGEEELYLRWGSCRSSTGFPLRSRSTTFGLAKLSATQSESDSEREHATPPVSAPHHHHHSGSPFTCAARILSPAPSKLLLLLPRPLPPPQRRPWATGSSGSCSVCMCCDHVAHPRLTLTHPRPIGDLLVAAGRPTCCYRRPTCC